MCTTLVVMAFFFLRNVDSEETNRRLEENFPTRHCPLAKLRSVIPNLDCTNKTPLKCARAARVLAQDQFIMEGSHLGGYAWGAVAIQSNSTIGEMTAWSIKAVKPSGWFCTTLSKDGSFVVHIFRTGYRFRNSTQDQWTYLAQPRHSSEVCPLASIRRYVEQLGSQPKNASNFVNELVNFAKFAYPSGQFDHEQFNVMVVTSQGRKLLGREMDYSFPVYFYDGHGAWCMKSTANGWLVVVIKIGYEDPNEESFSHSRRVL